MTEVLQAARICTECQVINGMTYMYAVAPQRLYLVLNLNGAVCKFTKAG